MTTTPVLLTQYSPSRITPTIDTNLFRKQFNIDNNIPIITQFFCSLESKNTFVGEAVLFDKILCFQSHSQARVVKISIPLEDITILESKMSSLIIPNLIKIGTKLKKYIFSIDTQERDTIFKILLEQWKKTSINNNFGDITSILDNITNRISNIKDLLQKKGIRYNVDDSLDNFITNVLQLPRTEALIDHFACALEEGRVVVPAGRLYITQNYIAFHENIRFSKGREEIIEFSSINSLEKRDSSVWALPNAIQIYTHSKKYSFSSFFNRNDVYDVLKDCWHDVKRRKGLVIEDSESDSDISNEISSDNEDNNEFIFDDMDDDINNLSNKSIIPSSFFELNDYHYPNIDGITLDYYGFEVPNEYIQLYEKELIKFNKNLRKQRRLWRIFKKQENLRSHIQYHTPELMTLIRKGIPFELRGELWYEFSGAREKKENSSIMYSELLTKVTMYSSDIGKDLRRTFPYHPAYNTDTSDNLKKLERVLIAYANRNPSVGYCQSMNFITAFLLLFLSEEKAFWVLVTIVEDRLQDYFSESMVGTIVDQEVFSELLKQKFPHISEHLDSNDLPLGVVSTRWLICLYLGALPTETVLRIWDLFFFHGSPIIITIALALTKMYETNILSCTSTESFMNFSNTFGCDCFDVDLLFRIAFNVVGLLDNQHLNYIRARYWETTRDSLEVENKKRDIYLLSRSCHFTEHELENYYKNWSDIKLRTIQEKTDCTPRNSLGIDYIGFTEIISKLAPEWSLDTVGNIRLLLFKYLDKNADKMLDFREMVTGMSILLKGSFEEKIKLFYNIYVGKKKSISKDELSKILLALYLVYKHEIPDLDNSILEKDNINQETVISIVLSETDIFQVTDSFKKIESPSSKLITMETKPIQLSSPVITNHFLTNEYQKKYKNKTKK